jgi:hypothetical protein
MKFFHLMLVNGLSHFWAQNTGSTIVASSLSCFGSETQPVPCSGVLKVDHGHPGLCTAGHIEIAPACSHSKLIFGGQSHIQIGEEVSEKGE